MFLLVYAISGLFFSFLEPPIDDYNDERRLALESIEFFGGDMIVNIDDNVLTFYFNRICYCRTVYQATITMINHPLERDSAFRNGALDEKYRWPGYPGGGNIPYVLDRSVLSQRKTIESAMKQYHDNTCIRFVPRTNEKEYVRIFYGNGCYSNVGRNQSLPQPQSLSLGRGCQSVGTIVHELSHTVGLFHEQNRSDRDMFLNVHLENVDRGNWLNFKKLSESEILLLNEFDYDSIMIYGNKAFSKNGRDTMVAKNNQKLTNPYSKKGLNKSDIERINILYKCKNYK